MTSSSYTHAYKSVLREWRINALPSTVGTFMARDALSLAIACLRLKSDDCVLLPAFICREVLRPFLGRMKVEFYDIGPGLAIDPSDIQKRLRRTHTRAMVLVNYFGFLQPFRKEIRQICTDTGTVLIEDSAHSLLTEGSGETGDLVVYSYRKLLPVPDGGGLQFNTDRLTIHAELLPRIYSDFLSLLISGKLALGFRSDIVSRAGLIGLTGAATRKGGGGASSKASDPRILQLSSFARSGIRRSPVSQILERRRFNFMFWSEWAKTSGLVVPIFPDLPIGVCPLGYPVRITNRDKIRSRLLRKGVYLEINWVLPETVSRESPTSRLLSSEILTLPVHPKFTLEKIEQIQRMLTPELHP